MSRAPHPFFSGPIAWHTQFREAGDEAREKDRMIMVAICRLKCAASRALVEKVLRKDELAEVIDRDFVPLACDADHLEPEVAELLARLTVKEPTPVCIYLTRDGRVVQSTAGGRHPAVLLNDLIQACAKRTTV